MIGESLCQYQKSKSFLFSRFKLLGEMSYLKRDISLPMN